MKKHSKTLQSTLFFTYSLIILMVAAILVSYFYTWSSNQLKKAAATSINNTSASISQKIDLEIEKIDSMSSNILYSNLVKDKFQKFLSSSTENPTNQSIANKINTSKDLIEIITAIMGPSRTMEQVYIYDFLGQMFGQGFDNRQQSINIKEKSWYEAVLNKNGGMNLSIPTKDKELSRYISTKENTYYVSLCRVYYNNFNQPQGILEIKQSYDNIFKNINDITIQSNPHENVFVYNNLGQLIYPVDTQVKNNYYNFIVNKHNSKGSYTIKNSDTKNSELLSYNYSDYTGWTTLVVVSENQLLRPLVSFTKTTVLVIFIIIFFALILSYIAAREITIPILTIHKTIKAINLETIPTSIPKELNSGINELEALNLAFLNMNVKLKKSMDNLLLSESHEMQSKMLALQTQMNPHFLYNTLATIAAMADENMDEQITEMCENVSDMLRYISSDSSPLVKMKTEIEYTEKYLACMKIRHRDKLCFSIEIDDLMREIDIPKLVIQPFVENSLKYGIVNEPPWNVKISGQTCNNRWQVTIEDNGVGFSAESLENINLQITQINKTGVLPNLELEGMGLMNIFIRLKLVYGDKMMFEIISHPLHGAIVTIGGSY